MHYRTVYSMLIEAPDDKAAAGVAFAYLEQLHDSVRVEGVDHPVTFSLESVLAVEPTGPRPVLMERTALPI